MKVITYASRNNCTIQLTPDQVRSLREHGAWPTDRWGSQYCTVSQGLHDDEPTYCKILTTQSGTWYYTPETCASG